MNCKSGKWRELKRVVKKIGKTKKEKAKIRKLLESIPVEDNFEPSMFVQEEEEDDDVEQVEQQSKYTG